MSESDVKINLKDLKGKKSGIYKPPVDTGRSNDTSKTRKSNSSAKSNSETKANKITSHLDNKNFTHGYINLEAQDSTNKYEQFDKQLRKDRPVLKNDKESKPITYIHAFNQLFSAQEFRNNLLKYAKNTDIVLNESILVEYGNSTIGKILSKFISIKMVQKLIVNKETFKT